MGISLIRGICLTLLLSSDSKVRHSILSFTHSSSDITGHAVVSGHVFSCEPQTSNKSRAAVKHVTFVYLQGVPKKMCQFCFQSLLAQILYAHEKQRQIWNPYDLSFSSNILFLSYSFPFVSNISTKHVTPLI